MVSDAVDIPSMCLLQHVHQAKLYIRYNMFSWSIIYLIHSE